MFDILTTIGVAAVSEIIKQTVATAIEWAKGRKRPEAAVVDQKVEQLVVDATNKVMHGALTPADRQRIVSGLVDVVRPTLDEVMQYSPNTDLIVRAVAKKVAKKTPVTKKVAKRSPAKKTAVRKMR